MLKTKYRFAGIVALFTMTSCVKAETKKPQDELNPISENAVALPTTPTVTANSGAVSGSKEESVRRLMEITGAADMGKQVMDSMLTQFKSMPGIPPGFIERFMKQANGDQLLELVVPVYMKHLDKKTIDAAIVFFDSPEGKAMVEKQPLIMQESMQIGQKWGQELAANVMKELTP